MAWTGTTLPSRVTLSDSWTAINFSYLISYLKKKLFPKFSCNKNNVVNFICKETDCYAGSSNKNFFLLPLLKPKLRPVINDTVESDERNTSSEIRHSCQSDATNFLTSSSVPYQTNALRYFLLYTWIFYHKLALESVVEQEINRLFLDSSNEQLRKLRDFGQLSVVANGQFFFQRTTWKAAVAAVIASLSYSVSQIIDTDPQFSSVAFYSHYLQHV
jgi:hypothetical protein